MNAVAHRQGSAGLLQILNVTYAGAFSKRDIEQIDLVIPVKSRNNSAEVEGVAKLERSSRFGIERYVYR